MLNTFQTYTKWIVITGAPSSGKTSVINRLKQRGYKTETEAAREVIEACLRHGRKIENIRDDIQSLQKSILNYGVKRYRHLKTDERIFLDRGLPDTIAYLKIAGLESDSATKASLFYHYKAVFIFDRLPVIKDNVRTEDNVMAEKIDIMLESVYRELGYTPIRIPVMSIEERADAILNHMNKFYQGSTRAHCPAT